MGHEAPQAGLGAGRGWETLFVMQPANQELSWDSLQQINASSKDSSSPWLNTTAYLQPRKARKCGIACTVFLEATKEEIVWILPFRATTRLKIHLCMNTSRKSYTREVPLKMGFKWELIGIYTSEQGEFPLGLNKFCLSLSWSYHFFH